VAGHSPQGSRALVRIQPVQQTRETWDTFRKGSGRSMTDLSRRRLIDAYSPAEMARRVLDTGVSKGNLSAAETLALAVLAGAFIAVGAAFATLAMTETGLGYGPTRVLGGITFSLGLILVVVAGAELFTGNNLVAMAWASRAISTRLLVRNWTLVYFGNLVGALATATLVFWTGVWAGSGNATGLTALRVAVGGVALSVGTEHDRQDPRHHLADHRVRRTRIRTQYRKHVLHSVRHSAAIELRRLARGGVSGHLTRHPDSVRVRAEPRSSDSGKYRRRDAVGRGDLLVRVPPRLERGRAEVGARRSSLLSGRFASSESSPRSVLASRVRVGSNAKVLRPCVSDRSTLALPAEGVGLSCGRLRRSSLLSASLRVEPTMRPRFASPRGFEREGASAGKDRPKHLGYSSGGGGIRTHEGFRPPVFKLAEAFLVWLRVVAFWLHSSAPPVMITLRFPRLVASVGAARWQNVGELEALMGHVTHLLWERIPGDDGRRPPLEMLDFCVRCVGGRRVETTQSSVQSVQIR